MFRTAAEIDRTITSGRLRSAVQDWVATEQTWFDGSPQSIANRKTACERMLHMLRSSSGRYRFAEATDYAALLSQLQQASRRLAELEDAYYQGHSVTADFRAPEASLSSEEGRYVDLESQKFFARQAGTYSDDVRELAIRAADHVEKYASNAPLHVRIAFVERVSEMGRMSANQTRTASAPRVFEDFDDVLLGLD